MRTLDRNKTNIWIAKLSSISDEVDDDGFKTGEKVIIYGTPLTATITLYPSGGGIVIQGFGLDESYDMVAVSSNIVLESTDLIFITEPVEDYDITYDYSVTQINKSLNSYFYGLTKRV